MEDLIVIVGNDKYQYKDLESLICGFINNDYYNMSDEEKMNELEKKAIANSMQYSIKVVKLEEKTNDFDEDAFILYDEITYILSMLKFDRFILLERTDANIFGKYINKENMQDNYIIINKFANDILKKYLMND